MRLAIQRDPGALPGLAAVLCQGSVRACDRALRVLEWWASPPDGEASHTLAPIVRIALGDTAFWNRRRAARLLGVLGRATDAAPLRDLLADPSSEVRGAAAEALAAIGDSDAWEHVLPLLDTPDTRDIAARVLATMGNPGAVPLLLACWQMMPNAPYIAEALGRLGDPRAIEPLASALEDPGCGDHVALALLRLGDRRGWSRVRARYEASLWPGQSVLASIAQYSTPQDLSWVFDAPCMQGERLQVVHTSKLLEELGRRDLRALEQGLHHPNRNVRWTVTFVLGRFTCDEAGATGFAALRAALQDPDGAVVRIAAMSLAQRGEIAAVPELLAKIRVPDIWEGTVETFAEALAQLIHAAKRERHNGLADTVVPTLIQVLPRHRGRARLKVVEALAVFDVAEANTTKIFIELLKDPEWRIKHTAIAALATVPTDRSFYALCRVIKEGEPGDVASVYRVLGAFDHPDVVAMLARGLDASQRWIRTAALTGLQHVSNRQADALICNACTHDDPATRAVAVWAAVARGLDPTAWLAGLTEVFAKERYGVSVQRITQVMDSLDKLESWPIGVDATSFCREVGLLQQRIREKRLFGEGNRNVEQERTLDRLLATCSLLR